MNLFSIDTYAASDYTWTFTAQFWSMIWTTLFLIVVCFWAWKVIKKADFTKAPTNSEYLITSTIEGMDNYIGQLMDGKLKKVYPYLLTVLVFLIAGVFIGLLGFETPSSAIMYTFGLAIITFIGIYVFGIASHGLWGFIKHKYINPLELFSQFGPLLSLSIRLFGGTFAFGVLFSMMSIIFSAVGLDLVAQYWPIISVFWNWLFTTVDVFLSFIQAFVFMSLTGIYWSLEWDPSEKKLAKWEKRKVKKAQKKGIEIEVEKPVEANTMEEKLKSTSNLILLEQRIAEQNQKDNLIIKTLYDGKKIKE